jgi:CBS-domain-containing membrane protein
MSPRAACRLEALGFEQVYDYAAGIADWKAAGLPTEGQHTEAQRIIDATRTDLPTCTPDETIGKVKTRTDAAGWDECVVIDCDQIVVGRLRKQAWHSADSAIAKHVMEPGPTTVRPDQLLAPLVGRMRNRGTQLVLVTTPQGQLIGAVIRKEAERLLSGEPPELIWRDCDGCPGRRIVAG